MRETNAIQNAYRAKCFHSNPLSSMVCFNSSTLPASSKSESRQWSSAFSTTSRSCFVKSNFFTRCLFLYNQCTNYQPSFFGSFLREKRTQINRTFVPSKLGQYNMSSTKQHNHIDLGEQREIEVFG